MVLGKTLGSATLAWIQGLIFMAFGPLTGVWLSPSTLLQAIGVLFLISFTFTLMGFLIAWQMESSQGFHAVMNLVLFPLWMVSGALFPMGNAHGWIQWVMRVNPLTYSLAALRGKLVSTCEHSEGVLFANAVEGGDGVEAHAGNALSMSVWTKSLPLYRRGASRCLATAYERQSPKLRLAGCPLPFP
jgi:hypothetical protein